MVGTSASVARGNALIVEVNVALDSEAQVYVEYENEDAGHFRTTTTKAVAKEHVVHVVRLRPSTTYDYKAFAVDSEGHRSDGVGGTFTTGELPEALDTITFEVRGRPTSELVLMDHMDNSSTYILVLDQQSNIVWYFANPDPFPRLTLGIHTVRQKPDLNLVFYLGGPLAPCCLREVTPLGKIVDQLVHNEIDQTPHHDFLILPDNKVLYLADVTRVIDDTAHGGDPETEVTGDAIRVWDQNSGMTWELWNAFEHLSTDDRVVWDDRNPKRWTHLNSIRFGPRGNVVVSSRYRNQVISISPRYQLVEWYLGGPNSFFTFPNPADRFYQQHTAAELPNGNILVFDNGNERPQEEGGQYSRALELTINDYDRTATKVWEYRPDRDIFASFGSSAQRLENGNTLVNFGITQDVVSIPITLVEVDRMGNEVWKLEMTGPTLRWRQGAYPFSSIMGETRLR